MHNTRYININSSLFDKRISKKNLYSCSKEIIFLEKNLRNNINKIYYLRYKQKRSAGFFDTKLKLDDPVGAISAHGVVGILGVMVVPFTSGVVEDMTKTMEFVWQFIGVVSIAGFAFAMSLLTILAINAFMPIRATDEEQDLGLDVSEVGVAAYPEFK